MKVKLLKKVGRFRVGKIGTVADDEAEVYGLGNNFQYPGNLSVDFGDGVDNLIPNVFLEEVKE